MNIRTQRILLNAGFHIYRIDRMTFTQIKYAKSPGGWGTYGKYETKTACKRTLYELMKDEKNLED